MIRTSFIVAAGLAFALGTGATFAQTASPAAPAPAAPAPATPMAPVKKGEKPRTAKSIACSGQADTQGLHGKPRKAFMSKCKSGKA